MTNTNKIPQAADFNLHTHFSENLLETSDDPRSAFAYCQQGLQWVQAEMAKPESEWEVGNLVSLMGQIANQLKVLQHLDDALQTIEAAAALIEIHQLSAKDWVVQNLRLADVLRYRKEFVQAENHFQKILKKIEAHPETSEYRHFVFQHLGKLHFDQGQDERALGLFQQALSLREKVGDADLIESTRLAIRTTEARLRA